jgi:hypothetical protein
MSMHFIIQCRFTVQWAVVELPSVVISLVVVIVGGSCRRNSVASRAQVVVLNFGERCSNVVGKTNLTDQTEPLVSPNTGCLG